MTYTILHPRTTAHMSPHPTRCSKRRMDSQKVIAMTEHLEGILAHVEPRGVGGLRLVPATDDFMERRIDHGAQMLAALADLPEDVSKAVYGPAVDFAVALSSKLDVPSDMIADIVADDVATIVSRRPGMLQP